MGTQKLQLPPKGVRRHQAPIEDGIDGLVAGGQNSMVRDNSDALGRAATQISGMRQARIDDLLE